VLSLCPDGLRVSYLSGRLGLAPLHGLHVVAAITALFADVLFSLALSPFGNVRLGAVRQERLLDPEGVIPQLLASPGKETGRDEGTNEKGP